MHQKTWAPDKAGGITLPLTGTYTLIHRLLFITLCTFGQDNQNYYTWYGIIIHGIFNVDFWGFHSGNHPGNKSYSLVICLLVQPLRKHQSCKALMAFSNGMTNVSIQWCAKHAMIHLSGLFYLYPLEEALRPLDNMNQGYQEPNLIMIRSFLVGVRYCRGAFRSAQMFSFKK